MFKLFFFRMFLPGGLRKVARLLVHLSVLLALRVVEPPNGLKHSSFPKVDLLKLGESP